MPSVTQVLEKIKSLTVEEQTFYLLEYSDELFRTDNFKEFDDLLAMVDPREMGPDLICTFLTCIGNADGKLRFAANFIKISRNHVAKKYPNEAEDILGEYYEV